VIVPDYQLSLAIGKEGQNARLAARLTGWRIDIRPDQGSAAPAADAAAAPAAGAATTPAGDAAGRPAAAVGGPDQAAAAGGPGPAAGPDTVPGAAGAQAR
jgi:N utilization substance protein A